MIDKNELMLGNWLLFDNKPIQVTALHSDCFEWEHTSYWTARRYEDANVKPTPITTEILEKFGFEKHDTDYGIEYNLNGTIISSYFELVSWSYLDRSVISQPLKHLHQLQNLYYILTGNQLNIIL